MALADEPRAANREQPVEARLRERLSPRAAGSQGTGGLEGDLLDGQLTVGLDGIVAGSARHPAGDLFVEGARETLELGELDRQARRHGVAAELADEIRVMSRDRVQHVADVHAGDGARANPAVRLSSTFANAMTGRRSRSFTRLATEPDDALMPALVEETRTARCVDGFGSRRCFGGERLVLHPRFDLATLLIELIESRSECHRRRHVVGEQALDADRHVVRADPQR